MYIIISIHHTYQHIFIFIYKIKFFLNISSSFIFTIPLFMILRSTSPRSTIQQLIEIYDVVKLLAIFRDIYGIAEFTRKGIYIYFA